MRGSNVTCQEVSKRESDERTQAQPGEAEGAGAVQNVLWLFQVRPVVQRQLVKAMAAGFSYVDTS